MRWFEKEEAELINIGFAKTQERVYSEACAKFELELKNHKIIVNDYGDVWIEHKERDLTIPFCKYSLPKVVMLINILNQKEKI